MQNNAILDSPYYLLATISDHIPHKRYHQHNKKKSANSLFCRAGSQPCLRQNGETEKFSRLDPLRRDSHEISLATVYTG